MNNETTTIVPNKNQEIFTIKGVVNNSFIKESVVKIIILSLLFSIFYPIGYFYKQWKAIKNNNESYKNISPFWRGLFYPIYAFSFMKIIKNLISSQKENDLKNCPSEEEKKKIEKRYKNNILLTFALPLGLLGVFLSTVGKTLVGRTDWPINAIIMLIILYFFQMIINSVLPKNQAQGKLTWADFLGAFPWMFYIFVSLLFYIGSLSSRIQLKDNQVINTFRNYSFTFPYENQRIEVREDGYICQSKSEDSQESLCMQWLLHTDPFEEEYFDQILSEGGFSLINKWTKIYQGNKAYCFYVKDDEETPFNFCYLKTNREKRLWVWSFYINGEDITGLEKLMNSYKSLE